VTDAEHLPTVVVAAAIVDAEGRLLSARRSAPSAHAGGWELPGGKVEPGETETDALRRELAEELGVVAVVGERVGAEWPLGEEYVLHVYRATVVEGTPQALDDHDELRWLEPGEWWSVLWLDADRPAVELLETL
jgi:8-oxo-dGTP diphosphatase